MRRVALPSGGSILMTSAPRPDINMPVYSARSSAISITRTPSSIPGPAFPIVSPGPVAISLASIICLNSGGPCTGQHFQQRLVDTISRLISDPMAGAPDQPRIRLWPARLHRGGTPRPMRVRRRIAPPPYAVQRRDHGVECPQHRTATRNRRRFQSRADRIPVLNHQREIIDLRRIGDHQAIEIDPVRFPPRLAFKMADFLHLYRGTGGGDAGRANNCNGTNTLPAKRPDAGGHGRAKREPHDVIAGIGADDLVDPIGDDASDRF